METNTKIAPCGLDCINCPVHEQNITAELRAALALQTRIPPEVVACKGCRLSGHCPWMKSCATLECAKNKDVAYCSDCADFPCPKFVPAAQGADKYPHNLKVYNLCRIKQIGAEQFLAGEARQVRELYFKGKLIPGTGPVKDPVGK